MSELPFTSPSQARRIWDAMARPSSRRVARKIRQAGRSVSHETINRWRRQGWRPLDGEPRHPLEAAREQLDRSFPGEGHLWVRAGTLMAHPYGQLVRRQRDLSDVAYERRG
jgi:hypothetical protein